MTRQQAKLPKKISGRKGLLARLLRALRASFLRVRTGTLFPDRLASSLGIDVRMVERYLQENEELEEAAKTRGGGCAGGAPRTIPARPSGCEETLTGR